MQQIVAGLTRQTPDSDKVFSQLGVKTFPELVRKSGGFVQALNAISRTVGGSQSELLKLVGSTEALNAMLQLTGAQGKTFVATLAQMRSGADDLGSAFDKQLGTINSRFAILHNNLKGAAVDIGKLLLPAVEDFSRAASGLADSFQSLSDGTKKLVLRIAEVAAAVGPSVLIIGTFARAIGGIATAGRVALGALIALGVELSVLSGGILAVLGVLVYLATRQTDAQKAAAAHSEAMAALDKAIQDVKNGVPGAVAKLQALSNAELNTAEAALKSAEAQVAVRQKVLDAITNSPGHILGVPLLEQVLGPQNEADVRLAAAKKTLADAQAAIAETRAKIAEGAQAVDASLAGSTAAASSSIQKTAESAGKVVHVFTEAGVAAYDTGKWIADSSKEAQSQLDAQAKAAGKAGKDTAQSLDGIVRASDNLKSAQSPGEFAARGADEAKAKVDDLKTTIATIPDAVDKAASSISAPAPQQGDQQGQQAADRPRRGLRRRRAADRRHGAENRHGPRRREDQRVDALRRPAGDAETAASGITQAFSGLAGTVEQHLHRIVSGLQSQFAALSSSVASLVSSLQASSPACGRKSPRRARRHRAAVAVASPAAALSSVPAGRRGLHLRPALEWRICSPRRGSGQVRARPFSTLNSSLRMPNWLRGFNLGGIVDGLTAGMTVPVPAFANGGLAVAAPASAPGKSVPLPSRRKDLHLPGPRRGFRGACPRPAVEDAAQGRQAARLV